MDIRSRQSLLKIHSKQPFRTLPNPVYVIYIAITILVILNVVYGAIRLCRPYPINPWESGMIVDAYRAAHGIPVYADLVQDHATTMYGPLTTYITAALFTCFGPNNYTFRLISLISALLLVLLLARVLTRGKPMPHFLMAWGLLFSLHLPTASYFLDARPDLPAALFSLLAVIAFYNFQRLRKWGLLIAGLACLVIAIFLKQTSAMFCVAPGVALLLQRNRSLRNNLPLALSAPVIVLATVAVVYFGHPLLYHYMFKLPGQYSINGRLMINNTFQLIMFLPLFVVLFFDWLFLEASTERTDVRLNWIFACLVVAIPAGILASAKQGGDRNSYLPALFAMLAFCIVRFDRIFVGLGKLQTGYAKRLASATFFAVLILSVVFSNWGYCHSWSVDVKNGDKCYWEMVDLASTLPGQVVCLQDPTIPMYAKGYMGRTLRLERDAVLWPSKIPHYVEEELAKSQWVIVVYNTRWSGWLKYEDLSKLGFKLHEIPDIPAKNYLLWGR